MQATQRTALRSARRLRLQTTHSSRRYESHESHSHGAHSAHAGPSTESFGVAAYRFTSGGEDLPYFTRKITDTYEDYAKKWADRNDLHTQAVEQAGNDRVLMIGETDRKARTIDLKFPEQLNGGCPWNVPAGQGHINLDNVIAKYEKEAFEANEKKLEQLRTNTVPVEQPFKPLAKDPPAVVSA
nr:nadh-ubiquinone oxidoreductase 17.8 kda subunit, mitochondrial [Quercus suber]